VGHCGPSGGLTVPSVAAQRSVIQRALADGGIEPHQVGYVEAHGTGTSLGDPIEIEAMASAYGRGRDREAALWTGSVKTNIGHLEPASGMAGLIKILLAFQHGRIFASPIRTFPGMRSRFGWRQRRWNGSGGGPAASLG
jgi:acyl transferase domain-containing protein